VVPKVERSKHPQLVLFVLFFVLNLSSAPLSRGMGLAAFFVIVLRLEWLECYRLPGGPCCPYCLSTVA
jgi:hypothetical protein